MEDNKLKEFIDGYETPTTSEIYTNIISEFGDIIHWETLFIIHGKVEQAFGVYNININKIASLREWVKKTKTISFT